MEIPNDLNKLLAQLQQVTSQTNPLSGTCASGSRPTSAEIDMFLSREPLYLRNRDRTGRDLKGRYFSSSTCSQSGTVAATIYRCWLCGAEQTLARGGHSAFRKRRIAVSGYFVWTPSLGLHGSPARMSLTQSRLAPVSGRHLF